MNLEKATAKRFGAISQRIPDPNSTVEVADSMQERIAKLYGKDNLSVKLPIDLIIQTENVRANLDLDSTELKELVATIKKTGLLHPPVVTVRSTSNGLYEIVCVAGHRRLAASKLAGMNEVLCIVRTFESEGLKLIASIAENFQRKQLNPLDLAESLRRLDEDGYTRAQLEELFDKSRKTISRYLKMSYWTPLTKELIRDNESKFTKRTLLDLASRKLSPGEVESWIQKQLNPQQPRGTRASRSVDLKKRTLSYFERENLTSQEVELIKKVLTDLKLVTF